METSYLLRKNQMQLARNITFMTRETNSILQKTPYECVYMHVYVYIIYTHVRTRVCVCKHVHMCILYIHIHAYIYIYIYIIRCKLMDAL